MPPTTAPSDGNTAGTSAIRKSRPSLLSDDEVFDSAEHFAVQAVRDPRLLPISEHFTRLARGRESHGWKKGRPVSQNQKLLTQMRAGRSVTRLTAMHSGVMNLTARIADLRADGHDVLCEMKTDMDGAQYGSFTLAP